MHIFTRLANYSVTCTFGCACYHFVLQDSTRLLSQIVSEWTGDVKSQLPKILGGVGPIYYLLQFGKVLFVPVLILASDVIVNSSRSCKFCVVASTAVSTRWLSSS